MDMIMPIIIGVVAVLLIVASVLTVKRSKQGEDRRVFRMILDFVKIAVPAALVVIISLEYYEVISSKYTYIFLGAAIAVDALQLVLSLIREKKDK